MRRERFGVYRGTVTQIDDPRGLGRVRLKVLMLLGGAGETDWAWPMRPVGIEQIVVPGEHVWVQFEGGDIERPVWTGTGAVTPARAVVLQSPNGTKYRLQVADNGTVVTTQIE